MPSQSGVRDNVYVNIDINTIKNYSVILRLIVSIVIPPVLNSTLPQGT